MFEEKEIFLQKDSLIVNYKIWENNKNKDYILIIHGWWWSSESWIKVSNLLFENWYNVIVPDLPWFWKTKLKKVFNLDDYAEFLEDFVSYLWVKDIFLWWHSNWWAISIKLALRWKLKIKKLILNNSAWIRNDKKRSFKRVILNTFSEFIKSIIRFFPKSFKNNIKSSKLRIVFYKIIWWWDYLNSEKNTFLKETYLNMISSDLSKDLSNIKQDCLLIWWKKDTYTPLSDWKKMHKDIINSNIIILDNEKHWIHLNSPLKLVNTFLENIN